MPLIHLSFLTSCRLGEHTAHDDAGKWSLASRVLGDQGPRGTQQPQPLCLTNTWSPCFCTQHSSLVWTPLNLWWRSSSEQSHILITSFPMYAISITGSQMPQSHITFRVKNLSYRRFPGHDPETVARCMVVGARNIEPAWSSRSEDSEYHQICSRVLFTLAESLGVLLWVLVSVVAHLPGPFLCSWLWGWDRLALL